MTEYVISGIWKNDFIITHYALHSITFEGVSIAQKISKEIIILLLENKQNNASTWIWNYKRCIWDIGENIEVVNDKHKYLRSNRDNKETNNLGHLINYTWISL